jgi:formate-dependent nitrite reductase membrane component NrfD
LAAGSSLLAAGADLTGRPSLRRASRLAAILATGGSVVALVDDLGRPERFLNMLRVFRLTSPMSVGSWLLAVFGPLVGVAAASEVFGDNERSGRSAVQGRALGRAAGLGAAALAPGMASYTATILGDTAVPTWHDAHRHLPFVFVGSAASSSGGLAMVLAPVAEAAPARQLALVGTALELAAAQDMERTLGTVGTPLRTGKAGRLMLVSKVLSLGGAVAGALFGGRSRRMAAGSGLAMVVGSALMRFGIFHAGVAAAEDPAYTVVPQRARMEAERAGH